MQTSKSKLYFIAIVPPEPVFSDVQEMKEYVSGTFGSHAALRSPPHITLIPPFWYKEEDEIILSKTLKTFSVLQERFELVLNGFDCFRPRVIFVKNEESSELMDLQSNLKAHLEKTIGLQGGIDDNRPFHPHMTIAFKDLSKSAFHKAWEEYKGKSYIAAIEVSSIALLKHNGKKWEVLSNYSFNE